MNIFPASLKLTFIVFLALINIQCKNKVVLENLGTPSSPQTQTQAQASSPEKCDFYKIETLLVNCYDQKEFFKQTTQERQNIIASYCFKQAFSSVWGVQFNPSPYTYNPESVQNTFFHWRFDFGNIQKGSPSAFPPNSLELRYQTLLNQFQSSLDTNRMNQCLGGNYPFSGPVIIRTSHELIKQNILEPETFSRCYKEQLDTYGVKNNCSFN